MDIIGKPLFYHSDLDKDTFTLSEEESRHCAASLRFKEGDFLFITDGKGQIVNGRLEKASPKGCVVQVVEREKIAKSNTFRRLIVAPPKTGERLDLILEKSTEIGIDEILFIESRYSERDKINLERLQKIAISAMKQSKQAFLPALIGMLKWKQFIGLSLEGTKYIAAILEDQSTEQLGAVLAHSSPHSAISILIGPEGDFSEEEIQQAISIGFKPISLGKNILRTETASIYALSLINAFA